MSDHNIKELQKFRYSFRKILTSSDLSSRRLAVMEVESRAPGPSVWLTGCVHGDEVGGLVVIQEVFRRLKREPLLKGALRAYPLMNPTGFEAAARHLVLSDEDLNRSFPGNPEGSLAGRIAHTIYSSILETKPAMVLDLHNDWTKSVPYAIIDPESSAGNDDVKNSALEMAMATGFLVVREPDNRDSLRDLRGTITYNLVKSGIPAITLELGEAYVVNEEYVADGVAAVWKLLARLGMVAARDERPKHAVPEKVAGKVLRYSHHPLPNVSGVVRFMARAGDFVKKGQKIARIYNVFGKLGQTLAAPGDGVVIGHSDTSVAMPGTPIMSFALIE